MSEAKDQAEQGGVEESAPSYGEIVWGQFRKYKLSHWALGGVVGMFLIAVYAPLISLDLPLTMTVAGERTYPWFGDIFNRNYFHTTVDIFFNSLMFLLPILWAFRAGARHLIGKQGGWSARKKRRVGGYVMWGCVGVVLVVNGWLYLRPVEKQLSDARTRWDSVEASRRGLEALEAGGAPEAAGAGVEGAQAAVEALEGRLKQLEGVQAALLGVLTDPLRGLNGALAVLEGGAAQGAVSEEGLQTLGARLERGLRDLKGTASALGLGGDWSEIEGQLQEAQGGGSAMERLAALKRSLEGAQAINGQVLRTQLAREVEATQEGTKQAREGLRALKQALKKGKDGGGAAAQPVEAVEAVEALITAQAKALRGVEQRLNAGATFPLVKYSFRFATGDFQRPMPWSKGGEWAHPFGTNNQSKDTFAQMVFGTRIALTIGLVAVAISEILGVVLGALAGYFGGRVDTMVMRLIEIMLCFPSLFMIMSLAALIEDRSIFHVMLIIGLTRWTGPARLVRGEFLRLRNMEFVQAARALGLPEWRIIFQHVLPNALGPVLVSATFGIASAILLESTISFLGVGDPSASTWGKILNEGRISRSDPMILLPGFAIFVTVSLFNLIGEGVRDALDPKMRK
jgi:ABC-type dipeptide/oligopeptide/nickel transport system permease subunit